MITALQLTTTPPSASGSRRRANALPSGHLLDEYRIETILGAGGFGVTYKALDTHLEAWVAIKEYFPVEWSFRDADGVTVYPNTQGQTSAMEGQESDYHWGLERFLDEARVLARIQHPDVVRVKRYFRAHGTAYIVMNYEEGEPLSAILRDDETLDEGQIRGLLEDVLPALQAVHEQGYLHRDIKPANLYLRSADHRVMLIDFGAARAALGRHSKSVTSMVTPGYSPPEQYTTRNDRYGTWTDIYALGAVLYRCVTGHVPTEAAERLLDDCMEPAIQAGAGRYSTNLLRVIDRALAMRPETRFRTVAEMQAALRDADSTETVIMAPVLVKSGAPRREADASSSLTGSPRPTLPPLPIASPVIPESRPETGAGPLEITQPSINYPPPADSRRAVARPLSDAGLFGRRPSLGLLFGGGMVATLAALLVWFWPSAPEYEPTPPPRYGLSRPEPPMERAGADGEAAKVDSAASSIPGLASPEATVDASPAESSMVMEPSPSLKSDLESGLPISPSEALAPGMAVPEPDFVVTEPDALGHEPAQVDEEPGSLPEVDDQIAQPPPARAEQDEAAMVVGPPEPVAAGAVSVPPPAAARSGSASGPSASRKPPSRPKAAARQSRPRQAGREKTELRPIVVTPPEWKKQSDRRASRNPWQPPTDTGFNQK